MDFVDKDRLILLCLYAFEQTLHTENCVEVGALGWREFVYLRFQVNAVIVQLGADESVIVDDFVKIPAATL